MGSKFASDAAERKAGAANLDLADIEGTGTDGNVTAGDVDKAIKAREGAAEATAEAPPEPDRGGLEHTMGGATTRDDPTDGGVDMLPGSGDEPQGPEDALGPGPKRGDYRGRVGPDGYEPAETRRVEDAAPGEPHTELVKQRPRADDIGDEEGLKGGVETADAAA